jgi:hypothetical protein
MAQVVYGPWNKLDLLKELLERETKHLQLLIELHKAVRERKAVAEVNS